MGTTLAGIHNGTIHGLRCQFRDHSTRQPYAYTCINDSFEDQEHICRTTATDGSCHVKRVFLVSIDMGTKGCEHLADPCAVCGSHRMRCRPHGDTRTDLRGRVGHSPHNVGVMQQRHERTQGGTGNHRDAQRIGRDRPGKRFQYFAKYLWFDRDNDGIGSGNCGVVVTGGSDTILAAQFAEPILAGVAGCDLRWGKYLLA